MIRNQKPSRTDADAAVAHLYQFVRANGRCSTGCTLARFFGNIYYERDYGFRIDRIIGINDDLFSSCLTTLAFIHYCHMPIEELGGLNHQLIRDLLAASGITTNDA